ncbi:MAG: pyridoxamine 5'-phosphate oxidase family protein [Clostridia bacterium]|nr:pyridoxamine 5'-phosphate oxidase family protein [Clostridia bacterium]
MEIVAKGAQLLARCGEIALASISEQGYPRVCVLSRTKSEGLKRLWVSTGAESTKVRHFKANPKAGACFYRGNDSVTLGGTVTLIQDRAVKAEMWLDWFINHYPGGIDDPNYCILEFRTEEATLWIDKEFVTLGGEQS